ncbi:MAG: response regulator [Candidatus Hydrogenedentes bacterium]|nr:response regulator [Candidatus Hydrogenedentota bacterium]
MDKPRPRILIVEDEPAQRSLIGRILKEEGFEYDEASTCAEGLGLFEKDRYACALIDLGLPDGSGLSLLGDFSREDPNIVPVILTGDTTAETIITAMRAGAFDYLRKPVDLMTLRTAIVRAMSHHEVARERTELFQLLVEEKEQLQARVDEATADLRQYTHACERSNEHLRTLLRLARMSAEYYADERMFRQIYEELLLHAPIRGIALCDAARRRMVALVKVSDDAEPEFHTCDGAFQVSGFDSMLASAEPDLFIQEWLTRNTVFDRDSITSYVYTQSFWNRGTCTVAFFLSADYVPDDALLGFLDTSSYFLSFEWERGQLLFHIAHHASLGNIGVELARNFIQPLTAIQMAADFVNETLSNPDAKQGMQIVAENVERLRRQTQEFRKLSMLRENAIETVRLDEYVNQALDMLSVAIQSRGVTVEKDLIQDCECVLLNGTTLARTILDLILESLRSIEVGGVLALRLYDPDDDHIAFEVNRGPRDASLMTPSARGDFDTDAMNPSLQLAERSVHSCGGTLTHEYTATNAAKIRILLPRNATASMTAKSGAVR